MDDTILSVKLPPSEKPASSCCSTNKLPGLLIFVSVGAIVFSGVTYSQNQQLKKQLAARIETNPVASLPKTEAILPTTNPTLVPTATLKQVSGLKLPVVVFEPPLSTPEYAKHRNELQKKVVGPMVDYFMSKSGESMLVSLLVQQQKEDSLKNQYPYSTVLIYENGGFGYESLTQTNGALDWWLPTCMGPCDYTEEFMLKYPQIVAKTNF